MLKAPKGVRDILPDQTSLWRFVEKTVSSVLEDFGFGEIRLPVFEHSDLFSRSIGTDTDIVSKEMYTFRDRGDRSFSLRPEGTASAVRAYLEHRLYTPTPYCKLYYQGPMFRAERPQAGRYRQFYQIGAEALGVASPYLDGEILVMLHWICRQLGLEKWGLRLNSVGCPACRPLYREKLQACLKKEGEGLCEDCRRRSHTNPLRVFDCKNPACREILNKAPRVTDSLGKECRDHFDKVRALLESQKVPYVIDPDLVRGLDYYTRTAFELTGGGLGAQNAFAGGGRYDELVKQMGGPSVPAVGFAIGMDRLVSLLENSPKEANESGPRAFLALLGEKAIPAGLNLLLQLRERGITAEMDYKAGSLKSQLKKADRAGAKYCLILGEEELAQGSVIIRAMDKSEQQRVPLVSAAEALYRES